jgi:hypothetical protein
MNIESARNLKAQLLSELIKPTATSAAAALFVGTATPTMFMNLAHGTGRMAYLRTRIPTMAVGIAPRKRSGFQIAVRCQQRELMTGPEVERIRTKAKNEVDVQFIGRLSKRAKPWEQKRIRPLHIGTSCGHFAITAGTLGCFVKLRNDATEALHILSNNHVLADENKAKIDDPIVQPGTLDGGKKSTDRCASLTMFIPMKPTTDNLVDAAIAAVKPGLDVNKHAIKGRRSLAGLGPEFLDEGTIVYKRGRTTSLTRGRVTAFELDNVVVQYDIGNISFNDQIEIEGADAGPFSMGGDSGTIIVDEEFKAVALLFAGGDSGGTNGMGYTYANPIRTVLDALKIDLV